MSISALLEIEVWPTVSLKPVSVLDWEKGLETIFLLLLAELHQNLHM